VIRTRQTQMHGGYPLRSIANTIQNHTCNRPTIGVASSFSSHAQGEGPVCLLPIDLVPGGKINASERPLNGVRMD
jgi:hypothetical protein